MAQLKEKLLYIAELDKERCFGDEKEELLEIYGTGDDDFDEEFQIELDQMLQETIENCQNQILQKLLQDIFGQK